MNLLSRVLLSGSAASCLSGIAVAMRSKADSGTAVQGANDTSHWLWGDRAFNENALSWRFTGSGLFIHHLSGIFWAFFFERLLDSHRSKTALRTVPDGLVEAETAESARGIDLHNVCRDAALVTVAANIVDFKLTPKRLTPGFEQHLSKPSLALVYLAFGIGLAAAAYGRECLAINKSS